MKKLQKFLALTTVMTMLVNSGYSQGYYDDSCGYCDSCNCSYMSAILPIGALVVAGILIATSNRGHHHHSSSSHSHSHSAPL